MQTIEEVLLYLEGQRKVYLDICNLYKRYLEKETNKEKMKLYSYLLDIYRSRWLAICLALEDIKG